MRISHIPPLRYLMSSIGFVLLMVLSQSAWAEFQLNLRSKHTEVDLGGVFSVSIVADGSNLPKGEPPVDDLFKDLEVFGKSNSTDIRIVNNRRQTNKIWSYQIRATRAGNVQLGPIQWGGKTSNALNIKVKNPNARPTRTNQQATTPNTAQAPPGIILEATIDKQQVPVRGQLIYTARVLYRVSINHGKINLPTFPDDAISYPLGNNRLQKTISGHQYTLQEWRYAVFPQKSGILRIPSFGLDGHARQNGAYRRFSRKSKAYDVKVLPSPANFAAGEWLVAKNVVLKEAWSVSINDALPVGQPITRSITIRTNGVPAEQLPALNQGEHPNIKFYPGQPELNTETLYNGVHGTRVENMVMIPTQTGEVVLPPIEIRWWDSENGGIQKARLPERKLNIVANSNAVVKNEVQLAEDGDYFSAITDAGLSGQTLDPLPPQLNVRPTAWWWGAILLAGSAWPVLGWNWWNARRRRMRHAQQIHATQQKSQRAKRQLLEHAIHSARRGNATESTNILLRWGQECWQEDPPNSVVAIAKRTGNDALLNAVRQLNIMRYQQERKDWDGTLLAEAIQGLLKHEIKGHSSLEQDLPKLYP